ncbi:MAG TPA: hypothetical protein VHN77_09250 [Phycisphaerales bacterium]|nr:hypothetical protein [Phycisphaerales bacterium]
MLAFLTAVLAFTVVLVGVRAWRYISLERACLFVLTPYRDSVTIQQGDDCITIDYQITVSECRVQNFGTVYRRFRCSPVVATRLLPTGDTEFMKGEEVPLRFCQDPQILAHFAHSPWPEMGSATLSGRDLVYRHRNWHLTYGLAKTMHGPVDVWLAGCAAALVVGGLIWPAARRLLRAQRGQCEHCGYSVKDLPGAQCPECGLAAVSSSRA